MGEAGKSGPELIAPPDIVSGKTPLDPGDADGATFELTATEVTGLKYHSTDGVAEHSNTLQKMYDQTAITRPSEQTPDVHDLFHAGRDMKGRASSPNCHVAPGFSKGMTEKTGKILSPNCRHSRENISSIPEQNRFSCRTTLSGAFVDYPY